MNSELNVKPLITSKGCHPEAVLACILYLGHGSLRPPGAGGAAGMAEAEGAGLN